MLQKEKNKVLDYIGLVLIGLSSLSYCLFVRNLAELHISLPFLNFPIFIGEILLLFCLVLFLIKLKYNFVIQRLKPWHYLLLCWMVFILIKTAYGYLKWGPLALRHSALFYYPLFTILGYSFYRKDFFENKALAYLFLCVIGAFNYFRFHLYFVLPCFILGIILLKGYTPRNTRNALFILLFLLAPYKLFFSTSRTMLISNTATIVFIGIVGFSILKVKTFYKIVLGTITLIFIFVGLLTFSNKINISSLRNFKGVVNGYNSYNKVILDKKDSYSASLGEVKLYNPEVSSLQRGVSELEGNIIGTKNVLSEIKSSLQENMRETDFELVREIQLLELRLDELQNKIKSVGSPAVSVPAEVIEERTVSPALETISIKEDKGKIIREINEVKLEFEQIVEKLEESKIEAREKIFVKRVEGDMNDLLFRIFIWRDMSLQLKEENMLLGVDFGKPFRSKSIEIIGIADREWKRDGWIAAHNSYLEIIYRTGFMGIFFILSIFIILFKMVRKTILIKSFTGVLLCGILINLFLAANALVFFELPYNAIPFWSLFGMVFAYLNKIKT